jgi:hypothetical protein
MNRIPPLRDRPVSDQARELARKLYETTFKPNFHSQEDLQDHLRRLTVTIVNALDEAREQDAHQIVRDCQEARRYLAELRAACRQANQPEIEKELKPFTWKCTGLERALADLARAIESGSDPDVPRC